MTDRVRRATPEELLDLRWRVLRVGRPRHTAHMSLDDHQDSRHWALDRDGTVIGCVSVMRTAAPDGAAEWQLRGMAIDDRCHRQGLGRVLLEAVQQDVDAPMWCNARVHAIPFYEAHGWVVTSDRFEVPEVGPHKRMHWDGTLTLHRGRFVSLVRRGRWEFARRVNASGVVAIAARTDDGALILVEQHRPPVNRRVLELPAGLVGDTEQDEARLEAARRELLEETGYEAARWRLAASGPVSSGLTDECVHLYVAEGLTRVHDGGGVDGEDIVVHRVPLDELPTWLASQDALVDHKVWAAMAHLAR